MLSKSMPNSSNYKSFSLQQSKQHSSNFPWSQKKLHTFNPFPRYNHSASEFDHNDSIIIFGGIVGEKTTNEVYVVEATYGDIPKPRSLHSQISFATHMIVFGGIVDDPKENNLDEHIYIFDIVSKHWLKQMICNFNIDGEVSTINSSSSNGSIGRFGHTATVVDTTLYVFGGKNKNNEYLNDFLTFDLKALKLLTKKKSKFKFSSRFGGCASHQQNQDQQLSQEIISGSSSSPYPKKTKLSPVLEEAILLSSQESILKLSSTNKDVKGKQKVAQQEAQQRQARSQQIQQEAQQEVQQQARLQQAQQEAQRQAQLQKIQQEAQRQAQLQQIQKEAQQEAQRQAQLQQIQQETQRQAQLQQQYSATTTWCSSIR
ncbi:6222_t:CDS:2 [Entrophospora sp. SA101]|nr:6222_t:CDS:2 [Entrophospora sp. SA101]